MINVFKLLLKNNVTTFVICLTSFKEKIKLESKKRVNIVNSLAIIKTKIIYFSATNFKAAPLIQWRLPVVSLGPSSKECPKCPPQVLHFNSVLAYPIL